ncbi:unnamed protein product [Urochloa humidicola]
MAAMESFQYQGRGSARFAAACGALSRYVKAAEAERAAAVETRPVAVLPLMPGADVSSAHEIESEAETAGPAPAPAAQQLTICYGSHVVVLDDVPADRATELLRLAAAQGVAPRAPPAAAAADLLLPVARKASLQRFMEKRRGRAAAARAAPYSHSNADVAAEDASSSFPDHLKLAL